MSSKKSSDQSSPSQFWLHLLPSAGGVLAWSGCASYILVQWGDTLSSIAGRLRSLRRRPFRLRTRGLAGFCSRDKCFTFHRDPLPLVLTTRRKRRAAPMLCSGETPLAILRLGMGFHSATSWALNPQIWNASLIFPGQVIESTRGHLVFNPPTNYSSTNYKTCSCWFFSIFGP